jgi:hypothetical protein
MTDDTEKLTPADARNVETALALALTGGKALARSQSAETMSKIVAERLVAALKHSGFVIMRKPIESGSKCASPYYVETIDAITRLSSVRLPARSASIGRRQFVDPLSI